MSLEEIVKTTAKDASAQAIFNNAGQIWNHTFFWSSLSPKGGGPGKTLHEAIERDLGGYDKFKKDFAAAGVGQFGSGWTWLVSDKGKLTIEKTANAMTPMAEGKNCILTIDVWEHAYYLDYQNRRGDFLAAVIDNLLNWDFAQENYARS
jgi:Fe-Mn family superoxide dismutase